MKRGLLVLILIISSGLVFGQERTAQSYAQELESRAQTFQRFLDTGGFQWCLSRENPREVVEGVYQFQLSNLQAIQGLLDNPDLLKKITNTAALEQTRSGLMQMFISLSGLYSIAVLQLAAEVKD